MTTQELNRDIKRLHKAIALKSGTADYYNYVDTTARTEFKRLYYADKEFKYMSKESIKMMIRLNLKHRFEPLHMFGIFINY